MMNIKKKISLKPLNVKNNISDKELKPTSLDETYYLVEILPGLFISGILKRLFCSQELPFIEGSIN